MTSYLLRHQDKLVLQKRNPLEFRKQSRDHTASMSEVLRGLDLIRRKHRILIFYVYGSKRRCV